MIYKIFCRGLVLLLVFITLSTFSFAEVEKLTDLSVFDFRLEEQNEGVLNFSFKIKNGGNISEDNLKYGLYVKNQKNIILDKYIVDNDLLNVPPNKILSRNFIYENKFNNVSKVILFISNDVGLPLATYILDDLKLNGSEENEKNEKVDESLLPVSNCLVKEIDDKKVLSCNKILKNVTAEDLMSQMQIYEKNIFGKLIKEVSVIPQLVADNEVVYNIPILKSGYYEIKSKIKDSVYFNKFFVSGDFVNIYKINLDKIDYNEFDTAKITFFLSSGNKNLNLIFGIKDGENKNCGVSEVKNPKKEVSVFVKRDCLNAQIYVLTKDKNGKEISVFNSPGLDVEGLNLFNIRECLLNLEQFNNYIYGILGIIFLLSLLILFRKRSILTISIFIISLFLLFSYITINKIFAFTYNSQNNVYTVDFSQNSYQEDDEVFFSLGVFDINSLEKEEDTSIKVSVDDGPFYEIVEYSDTDSVYKISLGKMALGNHSVKLRGFVSSKFDISLFDTSFFGSMEEDMTFYVNVSDEEINWCKEGDDPASGCIDPTACTPTIFYPLVSEVCEGDWFYQQTDCPLIGEMKVGTMLGCVEECEVTSWAPPESTYCLGDLFIQTSNCGDTRTAIGSDTDVACTPVSESDLQCSVNNRNWKNCTDEVIRMMSADKLFIKAVDNPELITAWSLKNSSGGINPNYNLGPTGLESVQIKLQFDGDGVYGNKKFYNLDVKAIGLTPEYTTIQLLILDPSMIEI